MSLCLTWCELKIKKMYSVKISELQPKTNALKLLQPNEKHFSSDNDNLCKLQNGFIKCRFFLMSYPHSVKRWMDYVPNWIYSRLQYNDHIEKSETKYFSVSMCSLRRHIPSVFMKNDIQSQAGASKSPM